MLKTKNGKTKMKGYVGDLLADYSLITKKMMDMLEAQIGREKAVAILDDAYGFGKMTKEELVARVIETLTKRMEEEKADE